VPCSHRTATLESEIVESIAEAYIRLQNWAFTRGFALAIESGKTLPTHLAESYTLRFQQRTRRLTAAQDKITAGHKLLPLMLNNRQQTKDGSEELLPS